MATALFAAVVLAVFWRPADRAEVILSRFGSVYRHYSYDSARGDFIVMTAEGRGFAPETDRRVVEDLRKAGWPAISRPGPDAPPLPFAIALQDGDVVCVVCCRPASFTERAAHRLKSALNLPD